MSLNQSQIKNTHFEGTKVTDEIRTKAGLGGGGLLISFLRYPPSRQRKPENRTPL